MNLFLLPLFVRRLILIGLPFLGAAILVSVCSSNSAWGANQDECQVIQAGFDVGSGSTKMAVALVDRCTHQIVRLLKEEQAGVNYYQDLRENQQKFSPSIQKTGLEVLAKFKAAAQALGAQEFFAVGAQAFREALNAEEVAKKIESTGIKFKILTLDEEAMVGFQAAAAVSGINPKDLAVWDIGGGSMQIAFLAETDNKNAPLTLTTYSGNVAAKGFLHLVLKTFYPDNAKTPNPYGKKVAAVIKMAQGLADVLLAPAFKEQLLKKQIVGIGSVHNIAVLKVLAPSEDYSLKQLQKSITAKQNYTDAQLGNDQFSPETLTNALLVAGFMQALKIDKLTPVKVHLGHGILGQAF